MIKRAIATLLLLLTLPLLLTGCEAEKPTFKVAYMICNSLEESKGRFEGLTAYLSEATGANFESVYLDTVDFEEAYKKGDIDFTHTNSLLFITLAKRHGVKLLASEKRGTYGALSRGTIIVRSDSEIKTLADLKGKRLLFGPQWAPFGFLSQYATLLTGGINPEDDLGPYGFPRGNWKHEKIIYSVLYGAYDAGAAPLIDLEEMTSDGRVSHDDFRVIAASDLAPYCTYGVSAEVSGEWAEKVREALLSLDGETTALVGDERILVNKRAFIDGFERLSMEDFKTVDNWARIAKMPPYEEY